MLTQKINYIIYCYSNERTKSKFAHAIVLAEKKDLLTVTQ